MTQHRATTVATLFTTLAVAATLAACNRPDDGRTAGQKVDGAVAKVEQKTEEAKADARVAGEKAKDNTTGAMDTVGFARRLLAKGLDLPWSLEVCNDDVWGADDGTVSSHVNAAADGMRSVLAQALS